MSNQRVVLAYAAENQPTIDELKINLAQSGLQLDYHCFSKERPDLILSEQLASCADPILLLISDNFLKSTQCMANGLRFINDKRHQLLPVVADGYAEDPNTGKLVKVPTEFERVSDIIQYINYWQERYLDMRRQKRQLQNIDEDVFNAHLKAMREISSEAGEFIRTLRDLNYLTLPAFSANDFQQLFIFLSDTPGWERFRHLRQELRDRQPSAPIAPPPAEEEEELPADFLEGIPGIELLQPTTSQEASASAAPEDLARAPQQEMPPAEPVRIADVPPPVVHADSEEPAPAAAPAPQDEAAPEATESYQEVIQASFDLAEEGHVEAAAKRLADTASANPQAIDVAYHHALLLTQYTEDTDTADRILDTLTEQHPDYLPAWILRGDIAESTGDAVAARRHYQQVLELDPNQPEGLLRLGTTLARHYPADAGLAEVLLLAALEAAPKSAEAHYEYGVLLADSLQVPDKAERHLQQALDISPNHPFAAYDLALLYHGQGQLAEAAHAYEQAAANNPELKTPENDLAFANPAPSATPDVRAPAPEASAPLTEAPAPVPEAPASAPEVRALEARPSASDIQSLTPDTMQAKEHNALLALKENIAQLEAMIKDREEETERLKAQRPGTGKTVLITGATSGIGKATAELLAQEGYRLIITGRRQDRLEALRDTWASAYHTDIETLCFDVRDYAAAEAAVNSLQGEWAEVDALINNAGKAKGLATIAEGQLHHWEEMIDTNIKGLVYMTRLIAPRMIARGQGHVVNISSTAGRDVYPMGNVYCATKSAVDTLTKGMRADLYTHGIRVSQVSPAHVEETEFALVRFDGDAERARIYNDFKPLEARDVADAIRYIISRPSHVNIQDVLIMGTQQAGSTLIDRSGRQ